MKLILTLCALAVCGAMTLRADDTTPPKGKGHRPDAEAIFKKLDSNGDGVLSKDEWMASERSKKDPAKAEEAYAKMDKAGDGKVTLEEFKAFMASRRGKKPGDAPANGDAPKTGDANK